jgi:hypothetical protein
LEIENILDANYGGVAVLMGRLVMPTNR